MSRFSLCLLALWLGVSAAALADEAKQLTITTWGGAYEASQRAAYFQAFEREAGVEIRLKPYNGGLDQLRDPTGSHWDVLDMTEPDALAA